MWIESCERLTHSHTHTQRERKRAAVSVDHFFRCRCRLAFSSTWIQNINVCILHSLLVRAHSVTYVKMEALPMNIYSRIFMQSNKTLHCRSTQFAKWIKSIVISIMPVGYDLHAYEPDRTEEKMRQREWGREQILIGGDQSIGADVWLFNAIMGHATNLDRLQSISSLFKLLDGGTNSRNLTLWIDKVNQINTEVICVQFFFGASDLIFIILSRTNFDRLSIQ